MADQIVCFHNPEEENGYLSNWYHSRFSEGENTYTSMEQYMMYCKAMTFKDYSIAGQIMAADDVADIKALGRKVSGYNETIWNGIRQIIVYRGLILKFSQNRELRSMLIDTGDSILAECAVKDTVWGIGLSMKNPDRLDMSKWRGKNLLGFALMEVRGWLMEMQD